jgi:hypothetical protein
LGDQRHYGADSSQSVVFGFEFFLRSAKLSVVYLVGCCKFGVVMTGVVSDDYISIKDLAKRLGMDRSHARRYVMKLGYSFHKRRTRDSGSQLTLCVTCVEADQIAAQRRDKGFLASTMVAASDVGVFYVIQLVPDLDPRRPKLGFAESLEQRLSQHRTAAPTAHVLRVWPCKRTWELTAIDALTCEGCRLILNEVFECDDPERLAMRGDAFFCMLPSPEVRSPLASVSPLNVSARGGEGTEQATAEDAPQVAHR